MLTQSTKEGVSRTKVQGQLVSTVGLPTLQLLCDGRLLAELSLDHPLLLIGRAEDNDMSVSSDYVSRYHVMLLRHAGSTILVDLESTNGTFVNSKRVGEQVLADGDEISVDRNSMFKQFSIKYSDPCSKARTRLEDIEELDAIIAKGLKQVGILLGNEEADLSPTMREKAPIKIGFIDDR